MKFRTERELLLEALATAGRAATSRTAMLSASPSIQLNLRGNQLEISGSDPDLVIETVIEVSGDADGMTLVPARLAVDIVRSLEGGAVGIVAEDEEVRITSGRAEFVMRVPLGVELTRLGDPEGSAVTLPAAHFGEGLRQVVRAALTDDTRAPQLTGVLMAATHGGLRLVATDSYRLCYRDFPGLSALGDEGQVLVPAHALGEVQRIVSAADDSATALEFRHSDLDAVFSFPGVKVTTRLLKGPFPDYERLIPSSYPNSLTIGREEFAAALRRVRLMVRDAKEATTPVRVTFGPGGVELTVLTAETGRAAERLDGQFSGEELVVAFNPTYLLDGVEAVRSEEIVLEVIDATKPAMVRGAEDSDYHYLLMPVRVS